jgi:putative nucleotidyltransferase with HDIG domain
VNPDLDVYIGQIKALPTAPGVLVRLITLFQQPDRHIDDVVALIRQDPSLTAGVLRYANSALFAPETPIVEVFDAIEWVGFSQVYHAVVANLASQILQLTKGACELDVNRLWLHSATAAVYAGAIGKRAGENEGLAFTAGLLHDVGKIVLSLAEGEEYTALLNQFISGPQLQSAEEKNFGFSHAAVGARLLKRWELPEAIVEPIRCHHQVEGKQQFERLCAVVSLGNVMAHTGDGAASGEEYADSEVAVHARTVLRLTTGDLDTIRLASLKDIEAMTDVFGAGAAGQ